MHLFTNNGLQPIKPDELIANIVAHDLDIRSPFDPKSLAVLSDLSNKLLRTHLASQAPQLVALGFWLRPSRIDLAAKRFSSKLCDGSQAKARGLALHLPPQNVDTLFVYSWALSLLAGNVNVTRLPSRPTKVLNWLITTIAETLATHGLSDTQLFCHYPHSSEMTARLSTLADLRMIWGGNEKIQSVSKATVRPDGLSLGFSDRKSFSVISGRSYAQMTESARDVAARSLYNDVFWFDQLGCGSPRAVFWLGSHDSCRKDLFRRLDCVALEKSYEVETGTALAKFSHINERLASGLARKATRFSNRLSILEAELDSSIFDNAPGAGMLYDIAISDITQIAPALNRSTQTITHLGLDEQELSALVKVMESHGGYRLVPVGEALSFSDIWDGVDLLEHMTRRITIKV